MFYFNLTRNQRRDELLRQQHKHSAVQPQTIHSQRMERCKTCCKSLTTFIFSRVGLCLLVVAYAFGGGMIFRLLEGPYEGQVTKGVQQRLNITVERLFNTSEQARVLYESNWTTMARQILEEYQLELVRQTKRGYQGERFDDDTKQWTFPGSILYAITVITTIGRRFFSTQFFVLIYFSRLWTYHLVRFHSNPMRKIISLILVKQIMAKL